MVLFGHMEQAPILVVDDDEHIRTLYENALTSAGLSVITAQNAREGLEMALAHHPSVVLLDIVMPPGDDGHSVVEKLRLDSWGKHARVIYLTNLSDPVDVSKAISLKSEDYIVKANTDVKEVVNLVRIAMHKE